MRLSETDSTKFCLPDCFNEMPETQTVQTWILDGANLIVAGIFMLFFHFSALCQQPK
jgi:hypothetical protein